MKCEICERDVEEHHQHCGIDCINAVCEDRDAFREKSAGLQDALDELDEEGVVAAYLSTYEREKAALAAQKAAEERERMLRSTCMKHVAALVRLGKPDHWKNHDRDDDGEGGRECVDRDQVVMLALLLRDALAPQAPAAEPHTRRCDGSGCGYSSDGWALYCPACSGAEPEGSGK